MQNTEFAQFVEFLRSLPKQITESPSFLQNSSLTGLPSSFDNIILTGMGGSAIAGDLMTAYLQDKIATPFTVNRNYSLPRFVSERSLVLACSYSGDTEETLSAARTAFDRNATVIVLTSGGQLAELAREKGAPVIQIPTGFPPRQALGFMFFPLLHLLETLGIIKSEQPDIDETVHILHDISHHNDPKHTHGHNLCNHIAQKLYKKIPIMYTASEILYPVVVRWRNQFNENSKTLAFSNVFPELNHNEIMGCETPKELLAQFNVVLLRDSVESPRNKARLEITRELLRKCGVPIFEVFGEGKSCLARMFSHIYIGDWVSYYLAVLYGKDPMAIESIHKLKNALLQIQ